MPEESETARPARTVTSVKCPLPSFSYRIDRTPSPTKRSSSPSWSKSRTATPEPGQMPSMRRFVSFCGGSRRGAPSPAASVASWKRGCGSIRSASEERRETEKSPPCTSRFGSTNETFAARSTRAPSARNPSTTKAAGVVAMFMGVEDLADGPAHLLRTAQAGLPVERIDRQGLAGLAAGDQVVEIAALIVRPDALDQHGTLP